MLNLKKILILIISCMLSNFGGTLTLTRKTSNTVITASGVNADYTDIEAVLNGNVDQDNLKDDGVPAAKLNSDVVRADYGLKQHTDGSLQVDLSDITPGLELTDGGLRVKVYGMINRTTNGLTFGRTGDCILSSSETTPDGWNDVSATYSNKFIRINATPLSQAGSDTHTHTFTSNTHSHTYAHTHTVGGDDTIGSGYISRSNQRFRTESQSSTTTSSTAVTGTTDSGNNVPAYVTLKMYQKA